MNNAAARRGFTLIELMVSVSIMILLTGIIITNLNSARAKARDAQRISDLAQIQLALTMYNDRCGQFPSTLALAANTGCPSGVTFGSFIAAIPVPPSGTGSNPWDTAYYYTRYVSGGRNVNYVLHASIEYANPSTGKGMNAASIVDSGGPWSLQANQPPFSYCSNVSNTSVHYCVGPY